MGTQRGLGLGFGGLGGMYVERLDFDFGKGRSPVSTCADHGTVSRLTSNTIVFLAGGGGPPRHPAMLWARR